MPGSALQKYLAENDVRVEKAPTGMSRQKTNLTRVTHKGNVMWTVEWIEGDGRKSVDDESSEGRQVKELWGEVMAKRLNAEKGKKRKREAEKQAVQPKAAEVTEQQIQGDTAAHQDQQCAVASSETHKHDQTSTEQLETESTHKVGQHDRDQPDTTNPAENQTIQPTENTDDPEPTTPECFYLLKPFTASKSTVLIPIDAMQTLTECLKSRVVLEYPTLYVLPNPPDDLPACFQLEEDYTKLQKAEQAEVEGLMQETNESTGGALTASREEEKPLDANSILDMLKRDVGV